MAETLSIGLENSLEIVSSTPDASDAEAAYRPAGSPPPPHLHPGQDERFEVLAADMRAVVGGEEIGLPSGTVIEVDLGALLDEYGDVFHLEP